MSTTPNIGSKSILAQLLASEGVTVRHDPKARTASFDVKNRDLILPVWKEMSNEVYDMLVGHEVGHALFTPFSKEKEEASDHTGAWSIEAQEIGGDSHGHIAMQYLNIVEDARIERLMKEKFGGMKRDFISGYKQLNDQDFFGIKDNPPTEFIDRINVFFKLGISSQSECGVKFDSIEQEIVDRIAIAKSFDDVVEIVKDIWEYESENNKKREIAPPPQQKNTVGDGDEQNDENSTRKTGAGSGMKGSNCAPEHFNPKAPRTQDAFDKKAENMVDKKVNDVQYSTLPNIHLENIIITPKEISKMILDIETAFALSMSEGSAQRNYGISNINTSLESFRAETLSMSKEFIQSSQRSVAIMVKQFEMKKAADAHKRTQTAKTGVLDCVKMMKYHFDEDIFRRHITIQKGKNHGFVMFIDWSASMSGVIKDTVKQCFMIALFCKKCNIPFEVYAFSSGHIRRDIETRKIKNMEVLDEVPDYNDATDDEGRCAVKKEIEKYSCFTDAITGLPISRYCLDNSDSKTIPSARFEDFSLLNFVSSTMSMKEMTLALQNMMKLIGGHHLSYHFTPRILGLGGTPLNCAIYASNKIVKEFRLKHNIQVMNTVFLTDGANCGSSFDVPCDRFSSYLIDTKKKETIDVRKLLAVRNKGNLTVNIPTWRRGGDTDTKALIRLHARETGSNTIGFYLYASASLRQGMIGMIEPATFNDPSIESTLNAKFKKDGFCIANPDSGMSGYKELFIVRGTSLIEVEDDLMDKVVAGSSVVKVRSAFRKQMQAESVSKNLLNRFVQMVASN